MLSYLIPVLISQSCGQFFSFWWEPPQSEYTRNYTHWACIMKNPVIQQSETNYLPRLSSQTQGWENIWIEQFQPSAGEGNCHYNDEHTIFLSLAPRPVRLLKMQGSKTYLDVRAQ